jgi:iron complex outermembrane receptor protein
MRYVSAICVFFVLANLLQLSCNDLAAQSDRLPDEPDTAYSLLKPFDVEARRVRAMAMGHVSHISSDSAVLLGKYSTGEQLQALSTVFLRSYGANGIGSVSIRGMAASHTQFVWNGVVLQNPALGMTDASILPGAVVSEIDIAYGGASLEYATGGLGGLVNINSAFKKETNGIGGRVLLAGGTFGNLRPSVEIQFKKNRLQTYFNTSAGWQKNNFTFPNTTRPLFPLDTLEQAESKQGALSGGLKLKTGENSRIEVHMLSSYLTREIPPLMSVTTPDAEIMKDRVQMLSAQWAVEPMHRWQWNAGVSGISSLSDFQNETDSIYSNLQIQSLQGFFNTHKVFQPGLGTASFRAGIQYLHDFVKNTGYHSIENQFNLGVFAGYRQELFQKFVVNALLRGQCRNKSLAPLLYALSADFKPMDGTVINLSTSRNFRFPSMNDLYWKDSGNPDLLPESGITHEVKIKQNINNKYVTVSLSAGGYISVVDNWIQWQPDGSIWRPLNLQKVQSRGFETGMEITIRDTARKFIISGIVNYTLLNSKVISHYSDASQSGYDMIFTPGHRFTSSVFMQYRNMGLTYRQGYTGRYYFSSDNYGYMPSWSTADVRLSYGLPKYLNVRSSLAILCTNVYNWKYQILPYRPEQGRGWMVQLQVKF